jgi:hypothetical protein
MTGRLYYLVMTEKQTIIDEHWFHKLQTISQQVGETYIALAPSPDILFSKRQEFESSGFKKDVSLFPKNFQPQVLKNSLTEVLTLRHAIDAEEPNPLVAKVYGDYLDNLSANIAMIIAAHDQQAGDFEAANQTLYGSPDKEVYYAVCDWIRADANKAGMANPEHEDLVAAVLKHLPTSPQGHSKLTPSEATFQKVRQMHQQSNGFYDRLFGSELPADPYINQIEGDIICLQMLKNIGSDYTIAASENNIWATLREQKKLLRPLGYRLDKDEFIGVVSHEIGSHIWEATNGSKQALRLLETGLAGYEKGNEGRAFLREQIVYETEATFLQQSSWEYIVMLHLAVCLAIGYDRRPYTFSELYELLYVLHSFWRERRFPLQTNNEEFVRDEAWHLAVRIMKGTNGQGGGYRKDVVYLEGNIHCWQLAAEQPELILLGDQGKFDITNPNHLSVIHALGII